jgi:hypothetical protein
MVRGCQYAAVVAAGVTVASAWACGSFEAAPVAEDGGSALDAAGDGGTTPSPAVGPVVLYTFAEGSGTTVKDVSGVEPALDLVIDDPTAVAWNDAGLTLFGGGTRVSSVANATKLEGPCLANGFTAEAWVRPDSASYQGPARILTYSVDVVDTRFFIAAGQKESPTTGDRWVLRVGSTTGEVGVESEGALTTSPHHVVAVVRPGTNAALYVDGVTRASTPLAGAVVLAPAPLAIGGETGAVDRRFTGTYSRVAIHCRAFSTDEVRAAYDAGSGH